MKIAAVGPESHNVWVGVHVCVSEEMNDALASEQ